MSFSIPKSISSLFETFPHFWCVVGGWAIDLFLEKETRKHGDIEITIFRDQLPALYSFRTEMNKQFIVPNGPSKPGTLVSWNNEPLELPVHQIRIQVPGFSLGEFDVLLNDREEGDWVYRRNPCIRLPEEKISMNSFIEIPILRPEIALLYKAKNHRPKDDEDLERCLNKFSLKKQKWLLEAIKLDYSDHPWLNLLA